MILLAAPPARADAFTLWGAGAAAMAEAGARAARADEGAAAFQNPAGLAFGGGHAEGGALATASWLKAAGQRRDLDERVGMFAALNVPVITTWSVHLGFLLHTPPSTLLRVRVRGEGDPQLPYYDNRSQRLGVVPALGLRPLRWLGLGAGVDTLAGLVGSASLQPGSRGVDEPRVDQRVSPTLRPIVGARVEPAGWLRLAAVYRGAAGLDVDTRTDATVAGVPLSARVQKSQALFDPASITAAASVLLGGVELELDLGYHRWSRYRGPLLQVEATLPGVNAAPAAEPPAFHDTMSARLGASARLGSGPRWLRLRAGAGHETSMLGDDRQGITNVVDGAKWIGAAGVTLVDERIAPGATAEVNLAAQAHWLPERSWPKVACQRVPCPADSVAGPDASAPAAGITDPGFPTLRGGGAALALALSVGARW